MAELVGIMISLGFFVGIAFIVWIVVSRRHAERMELIRQGINPHRISVPSAGNKALLGGLVIACLGLAGVVSIIVLGEAGEAAIFFSIAGLLIGGGMIFYHFYTAPQRERMMKLYEQQIAGSNLPGPEKPADVEKTE